MNGYGFMMGWTWVFWLLLIIGVVLLVILAVRAFSGGITRSGTGRGPGPEHPSTMGATTARRILDERYAKGELSTEEYRERLKVLGDDA
ncbi:SHOCT domain-containing protein [Arthrobacter sp. H14-L1]|uniref:SHOCT domain-containing protein n=1 Tax=Arthrobacter sp. H14-L1 TaxID=2996697 RepID=UPI002D1E372B|nr:SHOCT domain-containing protein [Arthrobacter sp. H14-L1]